MESTVGIALLGSGTVGGGVAELLSKRRSTIEERSGIGYEVLGIANRRRDPFALVDDARADLVVETIGGTGIALECIERALDQRKHVVTANKDLIATQGPRLRALAAARGVTLRYEAAVASAVPIISTLDHALAGDEILEIGGVLNGTCNFMLGKMREGRTFSEALAQAQDAGYAEADPRSDVQGTDAAHKLAILIQHAFRLPVITPHVRHRGIDNVTSADVRRARQHGYELKLVGYARRLNDSVIAEVGPVLVPFTHPFAKISGVGNIVRIVGASAGELQFSGAGAGREAAASAVLGDIVAALRTVAQRHGTAAQTTTQSRPFAPLASAFEHFSAFAGYPVLPHTQERQQGETHVGYSPRSLSAV